MSVSVTYGPSERAVSVTERNILWKRRGDMTMGEGGAAEYFGPENPSFWKNVETKLKMPYWTVPARSQHCKETECLWNVRVAEIKNAKENKTGKYWKSMIVTAEADAVHNYCVVVWPIESVIISRAPNDAGCGFHATFLHTVNGTNAGACVCAVCGADLTE